MRDELFDRDYQAGRAEFNAGLDQAIVKFGRTLGDGFAVLHRLQWSAPWQAKSKRIGRA
jgi:hypothetical protein